jgi:hypothetical protein
MIRTIVGLAVILAAGPAVADTPGYTGGSARPGANAPATRLTLGYLADAGHATAVELDCDPVGGGHPHGTQACATLDAAGGDPERIPPTLNLCTMIYAPIVAEASGTWHGTTVRWRHRYGNSCEMRRATGVLFDF